MQLDDVGRVPAVSRQGARQDATGVAVAPEHVLAGVAEERLAQECGLAGGDALVLVLRRRAGKARRAVSPAEQPPRHDAELVSSDEETQEEIVIFGPTAIAIAEAGEHVAADHQGGMSDRALD